MKLEEFQLKPGSHFGSGRVRRFVLPDKTRITQITTFCPDLIGPGPTHLYLIEGDAVVLVDAGMPTNLAKAFFYQWRNQPMPRDVEALPPDQSEREINDGLSLAGRSLSDIDVLVITHGHPDHFLMAASLVRQGARSVAAHVLDTPEVCNPWGMLHAWVSRQEQMTATGMPPAWSAGESAKEQVYYSLNLDLMAATLKVDSPVFQDGPLTIRGSAVPGIEVKHLPGHSPGSIGLLVGKNADKVLLCGDVLLNPITPHPDNLLVYLQTLREIAKDDSIQLGFPSHGQLVRDVRTRLAFLREHHKRRLRLTYERCSEPQSVWEIATTRHYFDTFVDPGKFNFLAGLEVLVHMELLVMVHGLHRAHFRNGVQYFQSSREPFESVYERIAELVRNEKAVAIMRY
ncbi:MAG TPA: MBL fold metallo-hydrolase [Desulfomonilaceae bacterium]|nr:MBL fold metallo-hydrolase [Desulfomonilaceae bacterium]